MAEDADKRSDGTDPFAFAKEAQERAAGLHPGMTEVVSELVYQKLGRPLTIRTENPVTKEMEDELIGISLPTRIEGGVTGEACIVFNSGDMVVIRPNDKEAIYVKEFSDNFSSSEEPLANTSVPSSRLDMTKLVHYARTGIGKFTYSELVASNDREENIPAVTEAYERGVAIAHETKTERDRVRNTTADAFMNRVRSMLNPPKPPRPDAPFSSPPPSNSPTQM